MRNAMTIHAFKNGFSRSKKSTDISLVINWNHDRRLGSLRERSLCDRREKFSMVILEKVSSRNKSSSRSKSLGDKDLNITVIYL